MSKSKPASRDYVHEALAWLAAQTGDQASAGHQLAAECLDRMGPRTRGVFNRAVEAALAAPTLGQRGFSFTIFSKPILTVFCWTNPAQRPAVPSIRQHTLAQMVRAGDDERPLMLLRLTDGGDIEQIHAEMLSLQLVPAQQRTALAAFAADQARKAIEARVREGGKIGRNEVCPCGSGKKYKQCCGLKPTPRR